MPANLIKRKQLFSAMDSIWEWLCNQEEYRSDYERLKKDIASKKLLPYEIKKNRGRFEIIIVSADYGVVKNNIDETERHTNNLKKKYQLLATPARYARQEKLRKKWGFYPLFPYDESFSPASFSKQITKQFGKGLFDQAVRPASFGTLWPPRRKKTIPISLKVEIDWRQGDRIIIHQLRTILRSLRKTYGIKPQRSRYDFAELVLKSEILKRAGLKKPQIFKRLLDEKKKLRPDPESKEAYRKTLERAYSKAK